MGKQAGVVPVFCFLPVFSRNSDHGFPAAEVMVPDLRHMGKVDEKALMAAEKGLRRQLS
jgi:hypothetical protein